MEQIQIIQNKIYEIRGQRVMLDRDLADLYGVETKSLKRAVKRNSNRFPERFMFQLTKEECSRCQFGTLNEYAERQGRGSNVKYLPYAFTEQGVSMLSAILRSTTAVQVCITIMDAFVSMKSYLAAHQGESPVIDDLRRRVEALEHSRSLQLSAAPRPLPEKLSEGVKVWIYSERALLILTEDPEDKRLLRSIGARFNNWLTLQGEPIAGWVFPRSKQKLLEKYLPEKGCK